jgi:hypothetical protein
MTRLVAHGLGVTLPERWEARVRRRERPEETERRERSLSIEAHSQRADRAFAVLHMASFPLPEERDDFGGNFTTAMRSSDAFITLFEYGPDAVHKPLFGTQGVPRVTASMFSPNRLQRRRPGQLGCQLFFNTGGRAFCLYVVAGSRASLPRIVAQVNAALADLEVEDA